MLKRTLLTALAASATLAFSASAHAAYLSLGTSNTSNATTTLTGNPAAPELLVRNTNGSSANAFGLYGLLTATSPTVNAVAVRGHNSATNGLGYGVSGSHAGAGIGVNGSSPRGIGVRGQSTSGIGVSASTNSTAANASALLATVTPTSPGVNSMAVRGINNGTGSNGFGVFGYQGGSGYGVVGQAAGGYGVSGQGAIGVFGSSPNVTGVEGFSPSGTGVYGQTTTRLAGFFSGNVYLTHTLTKGGGAFRIDHPLHPAHTYLQHSFVESPDMMDVYNGNTRTDARGFATVHMPRWFQALNRTFRYQLTVIDRAHWTARAAIWTKIAQNRFTIRTDQPHVQVSWQVTGIRHDRFANANRIKVVLPKAKKDQGKYLHPQLYGKPQSQAIGYRKPPRLPQRPSREH